MGLVTKLGQQPLVGIVSAVLLVLGLTFVFPDSPSSREKYESARKSTVLVQTEISSGSGVVVNRRNSSGSRVFVWTAAHVVASDPLHAKVKLLFHDDYESLGEGVFDTVLLGISFVDDLALYWVKLPVDLAEPAVFENTIPLAPGDPVFSVGNFLGEIFPESISVGTVAATGRIPRLEGWFWPLTDQTDLTVLPGASGGGVWSADSGKVVGIVVAGVSSTVSAYVPNRVIYSWAKSSGIDWAVYGELCPSDAGLYELSKIVAAELALRESFFFLLPVP